MKRGSGERENFMIAPQYLPEPNLSHSNIILKYGLKKQEVQQLQKRLIRTGDVFPVKIRRPKLLLPDHFLSLRTTPNAQKNDVPALAKRRQDLYESFEKPTTISTIAETIYSQGYLYKKITPSVQIEIFPKPSLKELSQLLNQYLL